MIFDFLRTIGMCATVEAINIIGKLKPHTNYRYNRYRYTFCRFIRDQQPIYEGNTRVSNDIFSSYFLNKYI